MCYPFCIFAIIKFATMKKIYFISITVLLFFSSPVYSQTVSIVRGPYLQSPGPNSMIMRWRTDSLTDSRVYYGTSFGDTAMYFDSATLTTEHRVKLTGLQ